MFIYRGEDEKIVCFFSVYIEQINEMVLLEFNYL